MSLGTEKHIQTQNRNLVNQVTNIMPDKHKPLLANLVSESVSTNSFI